MTATSSLEWADTAGVFAVPGLEPGKYWVHVHHPEYQQETDGLKATIADDVNEPLMIRMIPAGGRAGPSRNLDGSKSFDTRLELERLEGDGGREHWARVEYDGTFHATSIRPGRYRVSLGACLQGATGGRTDHPSRGRGGEGHAARRRRDRGGGDRDLRGQGP